MREIISPFDDDAFNSYLLKYIKARLKKRALLFISEYDFEGKKYTSDDIIKSINRSGRKIYFSNTRLINYIVYDISQRFWITEFRDINNAIRKIYCEYRSMIEQENRDLNRNKVRSLSVNGE